jgi:hypothetical protein
MGFLETDVCMGVQDALPLGITFTKFAQSTRCFAAEDRAEALRAWLMQQELGERLPSFEGTPEELETLKDYAHGKRKFWVMMCG